ncbi:MAG: mRNA turnover and ribosome assembly protein [Trizodia sp. TS-e1964]|nr:MAG: mRNA turnover and ribosome assembly protein [Trizodia sp. TS-e1964]
MPRTKRAKNFKLSKTDKKGKELTVQLFSNVRECLDKYQFCFVFSVANMRNTYLKELRSQFATDSRHWARLLKTSISQISDYYPKHYLVGNVGLFFTTRPPQDLIEFFATYTKTDFARAGVSTTRSFTIPAGVVYSRGGEISPEEDVPLAHSIEPTLRSLNVPSRLIKGKIELENEYVVCTEGDILDSRQTRLLKMFGVAAADFSVQLLAYWSAATNEVKEVGAMEE